MKKFRYKIQWVDAKDFRVGFGDDSNHNIKMRNFLDNYGAEGWECFHIDIEQGNYVPISYTFFFKLETA